ncbi:MAG: N-acetylglucosamine-6-phosphate deacetylase [Alphaproteobacteria bacterium]|nr:N-acetylglucosamine-6-phosphate deacetylase [Alphaproteobacteria bacterium]
MRQILRNARVLIGSKIERGLAVAIADGLIESVMPQDKAPGGIDLGDRILLPGFIDIQVNGGGGALFGELPSAETIGVIARAHRRFGTTGFLPTIISADFERIALAIAAVDEAIECGLPGILGIHIEGPFLNPARKGIHDASRFRDLDEEAFRLLTSAKHGRTLVTLAPEETTPSMIARLKGAGVIVSAGHTNASYAQTRAALDHGVTGFTHLFNAMSPMQGREPGAVGAALEDEASWCGVIVDGYHVDPVMLKLALRLKGPDRIMLVSDAMPSVGSDTKSFMLDGHRIVAENGVCVARDGTLAGSDLDMASALRNAVALLGQDLGSAANMASRNPAAFLGLSGSLGAIAPGKRADLVLMTDEFDVVESWIAGKASGPEPAPRHA